MTEHHGGPPMICATPVMRPGAARVGKIVGITLPRTVPIVTLVACCIGGFIGLVFALTVASGLSAMMYGTVFGGAAAWFVVTYSPLKGESLAKWALLQLNASRRGRYIDGERVTLAVGVAVLPKPPAGPIRLTRSSVRIPSSQYDERGVLISPKHHNLPADGEIDPLLFAALALPGEASMSLTPVNDDAVGHKGPRRRGRPARQEQAARAPRATARARRRDDRGRAGHPSAPAPSVVAAGKPQRLKD